MRIAIAADQVKGSALYLADELRKRGHEVSPFGAFDPDHDPQFADDWAPVSAAAAREVAAGRADQAIVCCWTGTGASIAANKVDGVRAALCGDAETAAGARRWNHANVLALSLRLTSGPMLMEILDAWFATAPSHEAADELNVEYVADIRG
ncbi:RpiB/LacA/LacB family sugar-phosphate isomerase [Embleya sp. NBC_00896]|uniref:RpiB/LacA/LacB family sugar-phosphate isomerase n=1 Tax=Embleya sp. NBC_00896 TaxID=2975961 RepID=UPI00386D0115|nr:RpiB/LacA/LacB family sugar-phosphate isomerase [Embleya sp. NBC_00896]